MQKRLVLCARKRISDTTEVFQEHGLEKVIAFERSLLGGGGSTRAWTVDREFLFTFPKWACSNGPVTASDGLLARASTVAYHHAPLNVVHPCRLHRLASQGAFMAG